MDQKRLNVKLDKEELEKANEQFKKLDHSERRATNLSSHINKTDGQLRQDSQLVFQNGQYVKIDKPYICTYQSCGQRFHLSDELQAHIENYHNPNVKKSFLN